MLPFRKINSRNMLSCLVASETHVRISPRWFPGQQHVHQSSLCILDTDRHVNDRLLVQRPGLCVVVLQRARRANTYKKSCPICVCVLHSFINLSVCPSVCLPAYLPKNNINLQFLHFNNNTNDYQRNSTKSNGPQLNHSHPVDS